MLSQIQYCMFIGCQPNWTDENNSEHNWNSQEGTRATKDYCGK